MHRTCFDLPTPKQPPPSPKYPMPAPSSGVCHEGQCLPESHDAMGLQSQIAVVMQVSLGSSPSAMARSQRLKTSGTPAGSGSLMFALHVEPVSHLRSRLVLAEAALCARQ